MDQDGVEVHKHAKMKKEANIWPTLPINAGSIKASLGKVHLIWQGEMKILKLEAWNFSSPPC